MPDRFSLRIESGDRAGETVSLIGRGLTIGRRTTNDLALQDSSVSGRHARLSIEGGHVMVIDFGSTNGTFVDDKRVEECDLKPGDKVRFGKIETVFIDAEAGPAPARVAMPAAAPRADSGDSDDDFEVEIDFEDDLSIEEPSAVPAQAAPARVIAEAEVTFADLDDDEDNEVHQIDAAALAKSGDGRGSTPLLIAAVVIAGGAGWYFAGKPGLGGSTENGSGQPAVQAVVKTPGNMLANPSFETEDESAWTPSETAPVMPWASSAWRASGEFGIGADLEAGQWGLVRSAQINLSHKRGLTATASALAEGGARLEIGIALSDSAGEHPSTLTWSSALGTDEGSLMLQLVAAPGYDQARVLLRAAADNTTGAGGFDDVALVASAETGTVSFGDFTAASSGEDHLVLYHIDRPLLLDLGVAGGAMEVSATEDGMSMRSGAGVWSAVVDPALLAEGLSTLGQSGYRPHADAFEDTGVTSVVIGSRAHQLRLVFPAPVTLKGAPLTLGYKLEATLPSGDVALELSFSGQRSEAARLNSEAKAAVVAGARGKAVRLWQNLLNRVPFDYDLVAESEAGRALMVADGLADLQALRGEFERASFFALPELFAACLASSRELEVEFKGCEVEGAAKLFADDVEAKLAELTGSTESDDERVRGAILVYLEQAGHSSLAARLRKSLSGTDKAE